MHQEAALHGLWRSEENTFYINTQVFLEDASGGSTTRTMALRPTASQLQVVVGLFVD
jgi:hypothetical protein